MISSLEYTLKIKNINNSALLEKVISTNEKVEVEYKDAEETEKTVTLTSSPKIKLTQKEIGSGNGTGGQTGTQQGGTGGATQGGQNGNGNGDNSVFGGRLPQTGVGIGIGTAIIVVFALGIIFYKKSKKYTI